MIKPELISKNWLIELHQAIESFDQNEPVKGFSHFDMFCKYAAQDSTATKAEGKVYRRVWKVMGQPALESHLDYGKNAFHDQEGQTTTNEIKSRALKLFFTHYVKKELKKISVQFREEDSKAAFNTFRNLFKFSNKFPVLKELENMVYDQITIRHFGLKQSQEKYSNIDRVHNGQNAFHLSNIKNADAIDAIIRKIDCAKYSTNLRQQAEHYFKRHALDLQPVDIDSLGLVHESRTIEEKDEIQTLTELFKNSQGVCFGEAHFDDFPKKFLIKHMELFKTLGVTTFFVEGLFIENQEKNDDLLYQCQEGKVRVKLDTENPFSHRNVITAAVQQGIRLVGIDTQSAKGKKGDRLKTMNYLAAKVINKEKGNGKFIVWMGATHGLKWHIEDSITYPSEKIIKEQFNNLSLNTDCIQKIIIREFRENNYEPKTYKFTKEKLELYSEKKISTLPIEPLNKLTDSIIIHKNKKEILPGVNTLIQCPTILLVGSSYYPALKPMILKHNFSVLYSEFTETYNKLLPEENPWFLVSKRDESDTDKK